MDRDTSSVCGALCQNSMLYSQTTEWDVVVEIAFSGNEITFHMASLCFESW